MQELGEGLRSSAGKKEVGELRTNAGSESVREVMSSTRED